MKTIHSIWQPHHLEDDLIVIKPLDKLDFEVLFSVASDPLIWNQHPNNDRYKKEVFVLFFEDAISCHTAFKIIDKKTGLIIGSTRYYNFSAEENQIAIGYTFLARKYWGGKYNYHMKKLLVNYALNYVNQIVFHISSTNFRSQYAIEKLGALKHREFLMDSNGKITTHLEYILKKSL